MKRAMVVAVLMPWVALANGFDSANVNPRDLALVNATVAAQEGSGAAFANPAALARMPGWRADVALSVLDLQTTWTDTTGTLGGPTKTKFHPTTPPALSVSYGTTLGGLPAGFGLAFGIPAGGNMFWPEDWAGRYRAISTERKMYGLFATGGVELLPQVRLGGGVEYLYITERVVQAFNPAAPALQAELNAKGGGFTYDVALEITPVVNFPLRLGVDYKHQLITTLDGTVDFSNVPPPLAGVAVKQDVTHKVKIPNVLNVGLSYKPVAQVEVVFAYTFNRYSIYDADVFVPASLPAITVPRGYSNGYTFRLGAEWKATERLALRGGVLRDHSGMPTTSSSPLVSPTYSPTLPDSHAWCVSAGAGWQMTPSLGLQGAVYAKFADKVSSSATADVAGGPFPGQYETRAYIYALGVTWRPAAE